MCIFAGLPWRASIKSSLIRKNQVRPGWSWSKQFKCFGSLGLGLHLRTGADSLLITLTSGGNLTTRLLVVVVQANTVQCSEALFLVQCTFMHASARKSAL